jgi:N-acetylmuramoyl-L-alanine amidase
MGKAHRRTSAVIVAALSSLALAGMAIAAPSDSYKDDPDRIQHQWSIDNNLDNLFRVAGPDRISTSIKLMESTSKWAFCGEWWHDGNGPSDATMRYNWERNCDTVIVASAEDYPDALTAAPLADVYNAPVLLTNTGSIDARVLTAIGEHKFKNAIIVGGTGIFPAGAMQQLEDVVGIMDVQQVGGINRYETAVAIAKRVGWKASGQGVNPWTVNVYLASGVNFPDALAAGPAAADNDGVVLLTANGGLEKFTQGFLDGQLNWNSIFGMPVFNSVEIHVVGGPARTAVLNSDVENINPANVTVGTDRYDTAAMLAGKFKHPIEKVAIASGENFPDGVAAGGFVANHDGALLLTRNAYLSPQTRTFLEGIADTDVDVIVVGGTGSVSRAVSETIATELYTW